MFTGIIEATSPIISITRDAGSQYLRIKRPQSFEDIKISSSIACNGICLTVLELDRGSFTVQVMNETVEKSSAGTWRNGDILNLERALKLGDRLDGHWVMGHIDRAVKYLRMEQRGNTSYYHYELHPADRQLLIPQGSVAINGVSLTVAWLGKREFSIALIEHSKQNSNLPLLKPGEYVNVEYDALGKYILRKDL
ncbi:MAG: riboflavin synthase [Candidatus Cloacimonetes bacterium]|jgi:riboflavin synthase|nr:riboflavin synthase [Candidatus Cloacimonadota bacterium]MDD2507297.1 riboflavin synthase [Candidatus Cloacimonadota bacterium]MDD4147582.1 riboflavin synthase [Candidatus Cloacimonadota bacterium]MDD4560612.1 riboflavin synthase [Candidatus Cloacimonadota bacterium]